MSPSIENRSRSLFHRKFLNFTPIKIDHTIRLNIQLTKWLTKSYTLLIIFINQITNNKLNFAVAKIWRHPVHIFEFQWASPTAEFHSFHSERAWREGIRTRHTERENGISLLLKETGPPTRDECRNCWRHNCVAVNFQRGYMEIWIELVTLKPQMPICRSREKAPQTVSSWLSKALRPKYINLIINKKTCIRYIFSPIGLVLIFLLH